ncbi:MAG TPA: phosphotransferase [Terriglobales bacterium]|jgi:5-methylthioribose kinase|nr:phosphotransferase [Terriglobales bacterium]
MPLDIENFGDLRDYLIGQRHLRSDEQVSFEKLTGGISNRTVKVTWPDGHAWILKQALPKLRVSVDWFSDPDRIKVEAKALRWMNRCSPGTAPGFVFEDAPKYLMAMEAIPYEHENWKSALLAGNVLTTHFKQFGRLLGTIHRKSSESVKDREEFSDTTYFENLRLDPYYLYTAEQVPEANEFLHALVDETRQRKDCLVHGDFSPKNVLLYRSKLILLDYEVFHCGEPAFDIGFAMAHFLSKMHHLPQHRAQIASATRAFTDVYRREVASLAWVDTLEPRLVRHALACSLARVAGKSLMEYMSAAENARQRAVVLQLMQDPPASIAQLISQFIEKIEAHA